MNDVYFVQKEGIYLHGVFWIGGDKEEGIKQADIAASKDNDDYHTWVLVKYSAPTEDTKFNEDADHDEIYRAAH